MIGSNFSGNSWQEMFGEIKDALLNDGIDVDTGHWQALKDVPHTKTRELPHVQIQLPILEEVEPWQKFMQPNLPWAEDHFQERVGGEPLNPGEQYRNWPWYEGGVEDHKVTGEFSHTYMERFWPRRAGGIVGRPVISVAGRPRGSHVMEPDTVTERKYGDRVGIRYRYGDLNDLLDLLADEPTTRQAYLPIWFPEDLAATREQQRVPCTLGYHFLRRDDRLHLFYPMRSVDIFRYLTDDIYMAGRLVQWVIEQLRARTSEMMQQIQQVADVPAEYVDESLVGLTSKALGGSSLWRDVKPGQITFFASSVHCFAPELGRLRREVNQRMRDYGYDNTGEVPA